MSKTDNKIGMLSWVDLTVENAPEIRDFYSKVVGWESAPVPMDDYDDFCMIPPGDDVPAAGICHSRGSNKDLPSQWLIYISVENLNESIANCEALGGKVISPPRNYADMGRYCVIKDPAGAVMALFENKKL